MTNHRTEQPTNTGATEILRLSRNTEGMVTDIKTERIDPVAQKHDLPHEPFAALTHGKLTNGRTVRLPMKEALLTNPDAANILRRDVRMVAFNAFNNMSDTFAGFTTYEASDNPQEEWIRDAAIGVIPKGKSGMPAPEMQSGFEGGTIIVNDLYRYIVKILGDWLRYDQLGKVRQVAREMGLSGQLTKEDAVYSYITTTGNYTRNSTTNDNNVGANQATTTFSADGLRTGLTTIATSKDRKSGAPLGYNGNTLICGPLLQIAALQLLTTTALSRTHGATTAETVGTGAVNPLAGMIDTIIISPHFGTSYQWALTDSRIASYIFQTVEEFSVFQQGQDINSSEDWLHIDAINFLIKGIFGTGFVDDRAWFYSDSTTEPTVS